MHTQTYTVTNACVHACMHMEKKKGMPAIRVIRTKQVLLTTNTPGDGTCIQHEPHAYLMEGVVIQSPT